MMEEKQYIQISVSHRGNLLNKYTFAQREVLIGRGSDSDVVIDNAGVSRQHAKILNSLNGLIVQDLNSGNGTFVNDKQVGQARLQSGDSISINKFIINVVLADEAPGEAVSKSLNIETNQSDAVEGGTVFLRPSEKSKVLMQSRAAAPTPKPIVKTVYKLDSTLAAVLFAGGFGLGLLLSWLVL